MRFDTTVYFRHVTQGDYDADTGNYDAPTVAEETRLASVTDTGTETLMLVYGKLQQGSKTVRLQTPYNTPFDGIRIGNKIYRVDKVRQLRTKQTLVISEVQ